MENNINSPTSNFIQGEKTARKDPFNFPVPGHSLTDAPESQVWDKPSRIADPEEAIEMVISKVEKPETKEAMKKTTIPMSYNPLGSMRVKIGIAIGIIGILSSYFISTSIKSNDPIFNFRWPAKPSVISEKDLNVNNYEFD